MPGLIKYFWKDLHDAVAEINPQFSDIVDEISPNYPLYVGEYPYGTLILDKGLFHIIDANQILVPLNDLSVPSQIQEDLGYTGTIPMGMIFQNSIETFFLLGNRTIPSSFYTTGDMISLWSVLEGEPSYQRGPLWSITSGGRTICMLPKITDKTRYEQLRLKYQLKLNMPRSLNDHWVLFEKIANHKEFSQPWTSKIIFFSRKWFEHRGDKKWARFYEFILGKAWKDSTFKRNQFIFDFAFSLAQKNKNLKPNPYLADTFKHLIGMGTGGVPGLKPATNNVAAPIEGLQKVFVEDYGLKKHLPVIMHLHHFSLEDSIPVYYSLEIPTTLVFSPRSSQISSKMADMRELQDIQKAFFAETLQQKLMIEKTPLFDLAKNVKYSFYHCDPDQRNEISNTKQLTDTDPNFKKILCIGTEDLAFPEFSSFFRGCISLNPNKEDF